MSSIMELGARAKAAKSAIANADTRTKNAALYAIAQELDTQKESILQALSLIHICLCLDVFVMEREFLIELIRESNARGEYDLDRNVLQQRKDELKIFGY